MRSLIRLFISLGVLAPLAATSFATDNLFITYDTGAYGLNDVGIALTNYGHSVDTVLMANAGDLATALAAKPYKNVFLWDIGGGVVMNAADATALDNFSAARSRNTVVDGRSYGAFYSGVAGDEGLYLNNVANTFYANGGGVWFGSDHDPTWNPNVNFALNACGFNQTSGIISSSSLTLDGSSPIMAGVGGGLYWNGWSVAQVPVGFQPNGATLNAIAWDNNNVPLISASIVPEPVSMIAFGLGLAALARRKRKD